MLQFGIVTVIALAAGAVVGRRLWAAFRPTRSGACPSCATGDACATPAPALKEKKIWTMKAS